MNFILALAGILCLVSGIQAVTLNDTINGNITIALTNFNASVSTINATINTADTNTLKAWTNWGNVILSNLTTLYNRFQNYPNIGIQSLATIISSLNSSLTSPPMLLGSDFNLRGELYPNIYNQIQESGDVLLDAAANMSTYVICTNDFAANCLKKYGANLTASPLLLTRYRDCVIAENSRIALIGTNMSSQINASLANVQTYFDLLKICNVPTAAALNATWPQLVPSVQCLNTFIGQIGGITTLNTYVSDNVRYPQTQLVNFRTKRCASLVQLDIEDTVDRVKASFYSCLSTGK
ncbi:uncharacterized protein LOC131693012 [Topomyia yanbarensis]|uniref:uncharacterized protein LOC131693012 n=1 Tax=Topomyia yanbarensis TaxID=2498891 RepID=UPI00273AE8BD|nr:uncharacterized protein LOC131693012 [Topomyia yanbarensis]